MISFRRDLRVSHDARGFMLASRNLAGRDCSIDLRGTGDRSVGGAKYRQLVQEGVFLPIRMTTKQGGTRLRVLLNEELSPEEQEEWIDHFAWKLLIPDGEFALIGGGYEYLNGKRDSYAGFLEIPQDEYRVDVYICFWGVNGPSLYEEWRKPKLMPLPVGAWFRKTRPGELLPPQLKMHCYEDPESDPGYQEDYDENVFDYDEVDEQCESQVDFIVQLTPLSVAEALPATMPELDEAFIPTEITPRTLQKCPRGLPMPRKK
ncbi:hypothetical protein L0222_10330 [bacterium]|nr:hypothetical protein [bacterium]